MPIIPLHCCSISPHCKHTLCCCTEETHFGSWWKHDRKHVFQCDAAMLPSPHSPDTGTTSSWRKPKGCLCPGKELWQHHHTDPPPSALLVSNGAAPRPELPLHQPGRCGEGTVGLHTTQRSLERQSFPPTPHLFLRLPSSLVLQKRPWPFTKSGKKPRITHPTASPCFSLQGD